MLFLSLLVVLYYEPHMKFVCQGCDIEKDAVVLKSGERVGASDIGLLATAGVMMVKVFFCFSFLCLTSLSNVQQMTTSFRCILHQQ